MIEEESPRHRYRTGIIIETSRVTFLLDCGEEKFFRRLKEVDFLVVSHCFDEETEVLTDSGWKKFPELSANDKVATLDEDDNLYFEKPVDYIEQDYDGPMYRLHTDYLDMCVTPNHRIFCDVGEGFRFYTPVEVFGLTKKFLTEDSETIVDGDESWVPYKGKVYCVELPKYTRHLLLVRREGRVHWSGNSHPDHVDGIRGRTLQLPVLASRKVISQLRKICELRDPRPGSRFEYKDVSLKLIPCLHSVKAPMWGLVLNEEIGIFTDIIAPRRGWDVLKNLKVYIGDGSTLNRPIIRRDKETGEIYGHTTMLTQLRKGLIRMEESDLHTLWESTCGDGRRKAARGVRPRRFDCARQSDLNPLKERTRAEGGKGARADRGQERREVLR